MSDTDDFDAFYNATSSRLLHQVYAMTGNLADAEECVRKRTRVLATLEAGAACGERCGWVRTVAWRIAAGRWRKARNGVRALVRHGAADPSQSRLRTTSSSSTPSESPRRSDAPSCCTTWWG